MSADTPHSHSSYNVNSSEAKCPFSGHNAPKAAGRGTRNQDWWPNQLSLSILRQHSGLSNPLEADFDYAAAFESLDYPALKQDIIHLMKTSQDWWRADFGHYGPSLSAWPGTVRAPTVPVTVAVAQERVRSASLP